MFDNKKGMQEMWWIIGAAIIVVLIVILVLMWFTGSGGKAFGTVGNQISGLSDCDGDKVVDSFDKCPCDYGDTNSEFQGCSSTTTKEDLKTIKKVGDAGCTCTNQK